MHTYVSPPSPPSPPSSSQREPLLLSFMPSHRRQQSIYDGLICGACSPSPIPCSPVKKETHSDSLVVICHLRWCSIAQWHLTCVSSCMLVFGHPPCYLVVYRASSLNTRRRKSIGRPSLASSRTDWCCSPPLNEGHYMMVSAFGLSPRREVQPHSWTTTPNFPCGNSTS
jgi:hypothetical protein